MGTETIVERLFGLSRVSAAAHVRRLKIRWCICVISAVRADDRATALKQEFNVVLDYRTRALKHLIISISDLHANAQEMDVYRLLRISVRMLVNSRHSVQETMIVLGRFRQSRGCAVMVVFGRFRRSCRCVALKISRRFGQSRDCALNVVYVISDCHAVALLRQIFVISDELLLRRK